MAEPGRALPALPFAVLCILLAAFTVRFLRADPNPTFVGAILTPEHLDSLGRYLQPVPPAARLDDYGVFLPANSPLPAEAPSPGNETPRPTPEWRLAAIIIASGRPIAIIDDQTVAPGATLTDGSVVESIERDHVIIREPNGTRHRLALTTG